MYCTYCWLLRGLPHLDQYGGRICTYYLNALRFTTEEAGEGMGCFTPALGCGYQPDETSLQIEAMREMK